MTPIDKCTPVVPPKQDWQEISVPTLISKTPLVSVQMITYNHELYIARAIDGILQQQTTFPIELVIGEDCSTDRTRRIVLEYQGQYPELIRIITSDKNVGVQQNAARTLMACRGKYVATCEGDDYWHHPDKLQIQVDYLEAHEDCGLVHSDYIVHNTVTGKETPVKFSKNLIAHDRNSLIRALILFDYRIKTCTAVVRRDLIILVYRTCQYEFSDTFLMGDRQLWIELAYISHIHYIDKALATYNVIPGSASNSINVLKSFAFVLNILGLLFHYADKYGDEEALGLKKLTLDQHIVLLTTLVVVSRQGDLRRQVAELVRRYSVPLTLVSRICLFTINDNIGSPFLRLVFFLSWRVRKLLSKVRSLRTARELFRRCG
jgi:glycosyltransferase involved in cell wall biosynthesis